MALDNAWMLKAKCREIEDPDAVFFPPQRKGIKTDYSRARTICEHCPVRTTCLAWAIAHGIPNGVWGGTTPLERKRMSRELKIKYRKAWWRLHPLSRPSRKT